MVHNREAGAPAKTAWRLETRPSADQARQLLVHIVRRTRDGPYGRGGVTGVRGNHCVKDDVSAGASRRTSYVDRTLDEVPWKRIMFSSMSVIADLTTAQDSTTFSSLPIFFPSLPFFSPHWLNPFVLRSLCVGRLFADKFLCSSGSIVKWECKICVCKSCFGLSGRGLCTDDRRSRACHNRTSYT